MANRFGGIPTGGRFQGGEGIVDYQPGPEQIQTPEKMTLAGIDISPYQLFAPVGGGALSELGESVVEGVKTSPGALKKLVTETAQALSPIPEDGKVPLAETAKGFAHLVKGGIEKLIPGEQPDEELANQVIQGMVDTYGSFDGLKNKIETDLPGFVGDVAAAVSGAGLTLKGASKIPKLGSLAKSGEAFAKTGAALEPVSAAIKGVKKTVEKVPQMLTRAKSPNEMYQSAVKFSTTLPEAKRRKLSSTALKHGVMPTYEGLQKLTDNIAKIDKEIKSMIDDAGKTDKKLKVGKLFKHLGELKKSAGLSSKPTKNVKIIKDIQKDVIDYNKSIKRKGYSPEEAQKLKQSIYKDLETYYNKVGESPIGVDMQMGMARQAKEFLEEIVPGIKELNKKDADWIELRNALNKPVSRISNRDLMGIGVPIKAAAGASLGESIGRMFGVEGMGGAFGGTVGGIMGVLDAPKVKSKLAILIDKLERKGYKPTPEMEAFKNILYETRKIPETTE